MNWNDRIRTAFNAASSRVPEEDVIEELAQHARAMFEAARAEGCSPDEATRRVDVQVELWRAEASVLRRRVARNTAVEPPPAASSPCRIGTSHDLRYAVRLVARQPRFAALVTLMMGLGIAATTTLFSIVHGVLLKPLPWPNADRLVFVKETRGGSAPRFGAFSNAAYLAWQEDARTIEGLAAWSRSLRTLSGRGDPERIAVTGATPNLFGVLGVRPLIGRLFEPPDEDAHVAILAEQLWRQRFGGDPAVLGSALVLDGQAHTIVGVLPHDLGYPEAQVRAYVPMRVPPASGNFLSLFEAIALLRPGTTPAQAAAEATARGRFVPETGMTTVAIFGRTGAVAVTAQPFVDVLTGAVRRPLLVLLAAVALLFATAIANVVSLQLARTTSRVRELAIRAAIGAGAARLTRQLLLESLLLGVTGGAAGLALAWLAHGLLPSLLPADFPRLASLRLDGPALAFAVAVTVAATVTFGVSPAWRLRRLNVAGALADDGSAPVGTGVRTRTARVRLLIMTGQVAIACVLLVGASLLGRSFLRIASVDRGYDPSGLITARLAFPSTLFSPERRFALVTAILDQLRHTGGVRDAAFASALPLTPGGASSAFTLKTSRGESVPVQAANRLVSAGIVSTLGLRVVAGRGFNADDTTSSPPVAVVNRAFARRYLGDAPVGAQVPMAVGYEDVDVPATVVGVLEDIRYMTDDERALPEIYYSYAQLRDALPVPVAILLVRTTGDPVAFAPTLRAIVRQADPSLAADSFLTMEQRMGERLALRRLYAVLFAAFASLALLIAVVGLFGVLSYSVAQRSRELAVRAALGATRADILRLVLRDGLVVAFAGTAAGLVVAMALTGTVASLLYGVATRDALTFVGVPLLLLVVASLACVLPARRASRLDPLRVLRGN